MVLDSRYSFWTKLFGKEYREVLELASVCEHPSAVWLAKLFGGRDIGSREEAREVFLGCENDSRALCFAGLLEGHVDEVCRAAELGDALHKRRWRGALVVKSVFDGEKSAVQVERDGYYQVGFCYRIEWDAR
jgi:hypothetical protein